MNSNDYNEIINNLKNNNELDEELVMSINNAELYNHIGMYYEKNNPEKMEKYLKLAANNNCTSSIMKLADYYRHIKKDKKLCKKYYIKAIDLGVSDAANSLACFCALNNRLDDAEYYLRKAINLDSSCALLYTNLGIFFRDHRHDNQEANKYFTIASEKNCVLAMANLGDYYRHHNLYDAQNNFPSLTIKYYLGVINNNGANCKNISKERMLNIYFHVANYYTTKGEIFESEKYYLEIVNKNYLKENVLCELIKIYILKNDLDKANYYFNQIERSILHITDCEVNVVVTYLGCVNNRAKISDITYYYNNTHQKLSKELIKKHYNKIITINSHFNYLITKNMEINMHMSKELKDVMFEIDK